jgi:hypothetical protein
MAFGQTGQKDYVIELNKVELLRHQNLDEAWEYATILSQNEQLNSYLGFSEALMLKQADILSHRGELRKSDSLLNRILVYSIKNTSLDNRAQLFLLKAQASVAYGKYSDAILALSQSELLYKELNKKKGLVDVYSIYASLYASLKNYSKALHFIHLALDEADKSSAETRFILKLRESDYLDHNGNFDEEYRLLEGMENTLLTDSLGSFKARLHLAWANYYFSMNNYNLALDYLNQAEAGFKQYKERDKLYAIYSKKAEIFSLKRNAFAKKLFIQKAIIQADSLNDITLLLKAKLKLAKLFLTAGEPDSASFYANLVSNTTPLLNQKIASLDVLKSIEIDQNHYKKALGLMEIRQFLGDSLRKVNLKKALASSKLDFDVSVYEEKKSQIENQITVNRLEQQNHLLIIKLIASIFLFAIIMGLGLFLFNKARNKKKNSLLAQKLIYLQLNAHFIFNSLTAIQSLILKNKVVNAEHNLQMFASLMQNILRSSMQNRIPLHEELSFLMAYLQLQKLRFGDELIYEINIDEDIDTQLYRIPPFLVYPFLEYAIEFCIQKKGVKGAIGIRLRKLESNLLVEIEDKGMGFLIPQEAFLKRFNDEKIDLFDLTSQRLRELNPWFKKSYRMQLLPLENEKRVLQLILKLD